MSFLCCALLLATLCAMPQSGGIDLTAATVVVRENGAPDAEKTAVTVLVEEAEKRTGVRWTPRAGWPESGTVIVATSKLDDVAGGQNAPDEIRKSVTRLKREGFVIAVDVTRPKQPVVWVVGADARGVLFGVGKLLRVMKLTKGAATLDANDKPGHVAGISDSRPPARLPQSRQLMGRLGCAAVRSIHSRAGDLRRQLRREHPVSG